MNELIKNRQKRNLVLFITSYVLNNLASGVLYDTYVNYLQEVEPTIATSFWAFYGYATFISAAVLLFIPKFGYKKILIFCTIGTSAAFFIAVFSGSQYMLYSATLLALTAIQLHYIMLAPYVAVYTENLGGNEIDWYTRTYYMGYVGYLLTTYLGGALVVRIFSRLASISYETAKEATRYVVQMAPDIYKFYLKGNEYTLLLVGGFSLIALIPILLITEKKEDYQSSEEHKKIRLKDKIRQSISILLNRNARIYLLYWALVSFAMGLFTSYYTVFLNRVLHIDKVTSSLLVSGSYLAIIVFMFFTPKAVRKFGEVGTIFFTMIFSVPFMLIIANGDKFGGLMVPVVGVSLFIRAGLANLSSPVDSSLSMRIVPKEMRPVYTSVVNFVAGVISIVSGTFTGKFLFKTLEGYRYAYYISAALYLFAAVLILFGFRKYNRKEIDDASN